MVACLSFPVAGLLAKLGWSVIRRAGIDLTCKGSVFGIHGAFTSQVLIGLARYDLARKPQEVQ